MTNILAIDSGGTNIKAILFNERGEIVARSHENTPASMPEPGAIEHDPQELWNALVHVTQQLFDDSENPPSSVAAMGICNQRASFLLWEKETGTPVTKLISWSDVRASNTADRMNKTMKFRLLQKVAKLASKITGSIIMKTMGMYKFTTDHLIVRLRWLFDTHPELLKRCQDGELLLGTLDSWFIYNLTGKKRHVTDYTNASGTGLFNPFDLVWNKVVGNLFDIPMNIFPEVLDTNGDFGSTDPELFQGVSIPIRAAAGDQMAALFGQCCFEPGSVKISQGSGAFVDMTVGPKPKLSERGLYPFLAWSINGKPTYMLEGHVPTVGTLIDWLGDGIGVSDTPKVLDELAEQCDDTEGVVFVPSPEGISFPYFNSRAKASILGLSLSTHRRHVARAVIEGIALSLNDIIQGMAADTKIPITQIKVDGGVSKSDVLLRILASFANITVYRAPEPDMTATGVAYLAGLGVGVWKDLDEIRSLAQDHVPFTPNMDPEMRKAKLAQWNKVVHTILDLY